MNEDWFILFSLVFARVGGLMMTAPIYGASDVPLHVRVLLAAALALLIAPSQWHGVGVPLGGPVDYLRVARLRGRHRRLPGLGVLIFLHGMTLAGELIGQASGLGIAEVFDPEMDENVPLFSRLLFLVAVCVFLCIGGHRMVMAGLLDTFQTIPPGGGDVPRLAGRRLCDAGGPEFFAGHPRGRPRGDRAAAGDAASRADRADPAAVERFGVGLRPQLPCWPSPRWPESRRGRLGVSGPNPARAWKHILMRLKTPLRIAVDDRKKMKSIRKIVCETRQAAFMRLNRISASLIH